MSAGGALFALTAVQAVSSISQGYAQKAESDYNSTLLQGKANLIDVQKDIEYGQYQRKKGEILSQSVANIAKAGIAPSGSAMAVMLNAQTQINIDQAIGQFNLEQQKSYTINEANAIQRQGSAAVRAGYTNGLTNLLRGASDYASYQRRTTSTTFDYNTALPAFGGGVRPYIYA